MWLRDIDDTVTAESLRGTVDHIAAIQLPSGMIPWSPGAHADPWNHSEAVMALAVGGRMLPPRPMLLTENVNVLNTMSELAAYSRGLRASIAKAGTSTSSGTAVAV